MKTLLFLLLGASLVVGAELSRAQTFTGKPQYEIQVKRKNVSLGKINVEMFPAIAPNHARNFDSLVAVKFYDSIAFHRVIPGFMIQGGDPNTINGPVATWGTGGSGVKLKAEFNAVSHRRGIISAARTNDPNSATSQFFICVANSTFLDKEYTVYGKVISGMNVADTVVMSETDGADHPVEKIIMFIIRTGSNDSVTAVPNLVAPKNDTVLPVTPKVTLRWNKVSDAMTYKVQVASDADFTTIVTDTNLRQVDTSVAIGKLTQGITYFWRLLANNGGNPSEFSAARKFVMMASGVKDDASQNISLHALYPNPASGDATVSFSLDEGVVVTLSIVDVLGRTVRTLISSEYRVAGEHEISLVRSGLASGVYAVRLEAGGKSDTKQLVIE